MARGRKSSTPEGAKANMLLKAIGLAQVVMLYLKAKAANWSKEQLLDNAARELGVNLDGADPKKFKANLWLRMFGGATANPGMLMALARSHKNLGSQKKRLNKVSTFARTKFDDMPEDGRKKLEAEAKRTGFTVGSLLALKQRAATEAAEKLEEHIETVESLANQVGITSTGELGWMPEGGAASISRPFDISGITDSFGDLLFDDEVEYEDAEDDESEGDEEEETE